ncbi:MAG TPA: hypothetical protein VMB73_18710 [Acetobacteraceae bacterium]|nr:hypothetical protein [Acetobacteraceae bacterium]
MDGEDLRVRAELLERKIDELHLQSNMRLIRAEMKIEAIRAGMVDLDGLKLLDLSEVKLNDEGEVPDAGERIARLKKAKPWLFGMPSSSSPVTPPSARPLHQKHATEMTTTEYNAARAALLKKNY